MQKLKSINQILSESNALTKLCQHQQHFQLQTYITEFVPAQFCYNYKVNIAENNVLRVEVANAMQRFAFLRYEKEILAKISSVYPQVRSWQIFINPKLTLKK